MKMIVISQENFDSLFQACLDKLSLETLQEKYHGDLKPEDIDRIHRKFHYEIIGLQDQLEKR